MNSHQERDKQKYTYILDVFPAVVQEDGKKIKGGRGWGKGKDLEGHIAKWPSMVAAHLWKIGYGDTSVNMHLSNMYSILYVATS